MKSILLIEDNADMRENTAEILELANYQVHTAENGKMGIELALKQKPDLIICDIMMPVLDGYGVLHSIQKHDEIKNTPFIFLTAKTEKSDLRKGMELGADDYITKPYGGTELLNAVAGRLRKLDHLKVDLPNDLNGVDKLLHISRGGETIDTFVQHREIAQFKRRQMIYSENHWPHKLFYIIKGKVKTFKLHDDGKELVVGLFRDGDFLGHVALLEEANYKDSAEAMEETEVAIIPKDEFEKMMHTNCNINRVFIKLLAKNVIDNESRLLSLAYNSLRRKVAGTLITIYDKFQQVIDISRHDLAHIAGTATESMIRTLSDFKTEKLIEITDGRITILEESKLRKLIN